MDMIFTMNFTKGHYSVKTVDGVTAVFVFSHCLMMCFIFAPKFVNLSQRVSELFSGVKFHAEIYKGS